MDLREILAQKLLSFSCCHCLLRDQVFIWATHSNPEILQGYIDNVIPILELLESEGSQSAEFQDFLQSLPEFQTAASLLGYFGVPGESTAERWRMAVRQSHGAAKFFCQFHAYLLQLPDSVHHLQLLRTDLRITRFQLIQRQRSTVAALNWLQSELAVRNYHRLSWEQFQQYGPVMRVIELVLIWAEALSETGDNYSSQRLLEALLKVDSDQSIDTDLIDLYLAQFEKNLQIAEIPELEHWAVLRERYLLLQSNNYLQNQENQAVLQLTAYGLKIWPLFETLHAYEQVALQMPMEHSEVLLELWQIAVTRLEQTEFMLIWWNENCPIPSTWIVSPAKSLLLLVLLREMTTPMSQLRINWHQLLGADIWTDDGWLRFNQWIEPAHPVLRLQLADACARTLHLAGQSRFALHIWESWNRLHATDYHDLDFLEKRLHLKSPLNDQVWQWLTLPVELLVQAGRYQDGLAILLRAIQIVYPDHSPGWFLEHWQPESIIEQHVWLQFLSIWQIDHAEQVISTLLSKLGFQLNLPISLNHLVKCDSLFLWQLVGLLVQTMAGRIPHTDYETKIVEFCNELNGTPWGLLRDTFLKQADQQLWQSWLLQVAHAGSTALNAQTRYQDSFQLLNRILAEFADQDKIQRWWESGPVATLLPVFCKCLLETGRKEGLSQIIRQCKNWSQVISEDNLGGSQVALFFALEILPILRKSDPVSAVMLCRAILARFPVDFIPAEMPFRSRISTITLTYQLRQEILQTIWDEIARTVGPADLWNECFHWEEQISQLYLREIHNQQTSHQQTIENVVLSTMNPIDSVPVHEDQWLLPEMSPEHHVDDADLLLKAGVTHSGQVIWSLWKDRKLVRSGKCTPTASEIEQLIQLHQNKIHQAHQETAKALIHIQHQRDRITEFTSLEIQQKLRIQLAQQEAQLNIEIQQKLDGITDHFLRESSQMIDLQDILGNVAGGNLKLQVHGILHRIPWRFLVVNDRYCIEQFRTIRKIVTTTSDRASNNTDVMTIGALSWFPSIPGQEFCRTTAARWHNQLIRLANEYRTAVVAAGEQPIADRHALRQLTAIPTSVVCLLGHGTERGGMELADGPWNGLLELTWQHTRLILQLSCSLGNVRQDFFGDWQGYLSNLLSERARAVIAGLWELLPADAAKAGVLIVQRFLENLSSSHSLPSAEALAWYQRHMLKTAPVGLHTFAGLEFIGIN